MERPPLSVILVRHGARLDKADANWSSNSPTPYDSPLTYNGWTDSEALGMRIGSMLHQYEHWNSRVDSPLQDSAIHNNFNGDQSQTRGKRKLSVVMHSSPYMRCTQTAIAVGAGIARAYGESRYTDLPDRRPEGQERTAEILKRQRSTSASHSSAAKPSMEKPEMFGTSMSSRNIPPIENPRRIKLRLDAFLGEWLTPEYFEHTYASPNAAQLLASAKIDLLRESGCNRHNCSDNLMRRAATLNDSIEVYKNDESENGKRYIASKNSSEQSFRLQGYATSQDLTCDAYNKRDLRLPTVSSKDFHHEHGREDSSFGFDRYSQPEPIPHSIVGQAKNDYIEVDSQWNSTKEPLLWGDGGEVGEGWSSMHQRLTKGLHRMLNWYTTEESHDSYSVKAANPLPTEEYDSDTVLVLVTHGGGCNALIGAFTNQPVLVDVGTSSLTMFVRKDNAGEGFLRCSVASKMELSAPQRDLSKIYDLRLLAVTQHLQSAVDPTKLRYNPLIHPSTLYRPEDEHETGLMKVQAQFGSHFSIGTAKNGINGPFQTSLHTDFGSNYFSRDSPQFDLSSNGHVTGFRFWSDQNYYSSTGRSCLDDTSDSSSEDNFLLNFVDV